MNHCSKLFALAVSALMVAGALAVFVPSEDVESSPVSHSTVIITDPIVFPTTRMTTYENDGLTWDGSHGKLDNFNLVHNSLPNMYGHTFYMFDINSATFELVGTSTITVNIANDTINDIEAIYSHEITFTGSGTLNIIYNVGNGSIQKITGIDAQGPLTIDGCKVNVTFNNGNNMTYLYGIHTIGKTSIVNGAELRVGINNIKCYEKEYGMYLEGDLAVTDSTLDIRCVNTGDGKAYGITVLSTHDVGFSGSTVHVQAGTNAFDMKYSSIRTDETIYGGNVLDKKPGDLIGTDKIGDYKVVWITTEKPVSIQVFGMALFLILFTSALVAMLAFVRKD